MAKPPLYLRGMHGIGDCIHQRALIRMLKENHSVTLESSWHSLYWDLINEDFRVVGRGVSLRTQQKNAAREKTLFAPTPPHHHITSVQRVSYSTGTIAQTASGTITEAMLRSIGLGHRYHEADFRLPMRLEWLAEAERIMALWPTGDKPVMLYRPLCERPEWIGSRVRNANVADYRALADMLHEKFFIVSVADLEENKEWIVGPEFPADLKFHRGEFVIEILAALFHRVDLIFTSGGFAAILGPAVGTPTLSVLGGYEPKEWCGDGARYSSYLAIEPIKPCRCGSSGCMQLCTKQIDLAKARAAAAEFTSMTVASPAVHHTGDAPMLKLPDVSLLCVETQMHELARMTLADAATKVEFGEIVIHTDKPDLISLPGARYVEVPNWPEKIQCGTYCYNVAPQSVNTSHMIFIEWDGCVRDVNAWEPSFLDYDYIGAPWPGARGGQWTPREGCSVGNGGFTLWSKRLMDCVAENPEMKIATDTHISIDHRRTLETQCGAKWASEPTAFRFSYEHGTEAERVRTSFGVHDVFNWPLALPKAEVIARARLLMANDYIAARTSKLSSMAQRAPYLRTEIPGYDDRMSLYRQPSRTHRSRVQIPQGRSSLQPYQAAPPRPRPIFPPMAPRHTMTRTQWELEMQRRGLKA